MIAVAALVPNTSGLFNFHNCLFGNIAKNTAVKTTFTGKCPFVVFCLTHGKIVIRRVRKGSNLGLGQKQLQLLVRTTGI